MVYVYLEGDKCGFMAIRACLSGKGGMPKSSHKGKRKCPPLSMAVSLAVRSAVTNHTLPALGNYKCITGGCK